MPEKLSLWETLWVPTQMESSYPDGKHYASQQVLLDLSGAVPDQTTLNLRHPKFFWGVEVLLKVLRSGHQHAVQLLKI